MKTRICVVGAGCVGLSTAVNLQDKLSHCDVTLMADRFSPGTTSDVAAGLLYPYAVQETPETIGDIRRWAMATRDHVAALYQSPLASDLGISHLSMTLAYRRRVEKAAKYITSEDGKDIPFEAGILEGLRRLSPEELSRLGPELVDGFICNTYTLECMKYLPWLLNRFLENGGHVVGKSISCLEEVSDEYDVIINCTGIASKTVARDPEVQPIRGQVIRVKAPWIKNIYFLDDKYYVIPGSEIVVLGGTKQTDNWSLDINEDDASDIWNECTKFLPSLKKAAVVKHQVGLRPARYHVRLESEIIQHKGKKKLIVHNYGHGGSGITLFGGCALDVTSLVEQKLTEIHPSHKL